MIVEWGLVVALSGFAITFVLGMWYSVKLWAKQIEKKKE